MKAPTFSEAGGLLLLVAVAGVGYWVWRSGVISTLSAPGAFNPASDQNLAYQGTNAVVQGLAGESDATLGSKWFDWFRNDDGSYKPLAYFTALPLIDTATGIAPWSSPDPFLSVQAGQSKSAQLGYGAPSMAVKKPWYQSIWDSLYFMQGA